MSPQISLLERNKDAAISSHLKYKPRVSYEAGGKVMFYYKPLLEDNTICEPFQDPIHRKDSDRKFA
jgi:hypothetical protein